MSWETMQALWLSWRYSDAGRTSWELSWVLRKRLLCWWVTGRERSQADSTQHTKPGFHRGCGVPGRQAVTASLSFGQNKDRSQRELGAGSRRKGMQAYSVVSDSLWPPWTVALQAPPSMGFSRQEYWSGLPFLSPGDLPSPGIEPASLTSPALAGGFLTPAPRGKHR